MTEYTKLVEALRCRATHDWTNCGNCKYADEDDDPRGCWGTEICADAAASIEALQAQLPKRGKWIDSKERMRPDMCSVCGCVYEADRFMDKIAWNYCPNCGAKMEVQK